MNNIPFNRPYVSGREKDYMIGLFDQGNFAGPGHFSGLAETLLKDLTGAREVFLTSSGTAALELMCMTSGLNPGDEVILPSFTYPSTANALLRVGAVPVFIDIRKDTFNLDERLIEEAISKRTRAIIPVHYAGVGCEMDAILNIASRYGLFVLEDAAQCIDSYFRSSHLGTLGQMGALSFHETKNIHSGQGGALLINEESLISRAEILLEHGTDRRQFMRGQTESYSWKDAGSSFSMSEVTATFLYAQLEGLSGVTLERREIWEKYHRALERYEDAGILIRPSIPDHCRHNGHCYPVLLPSFEIREKVRGALADRGIMAHFHYVPLHSSSMGKRICQKAHYLPDTEEVAERLLRMPLYSGLDVEDCLARIEGVFQEIFSGKLA